MCSFSSLNGLFVTSGEGVIKVTLLIFEVTAGFVSGSSVTFDFILVDFRELDNKSLLEPDVERMYDEDTLKGLYIVY